MKAELTRVVESLLFTSDRPLTVDQVIEVLPEADREGVEAALAELRAIYDDTQRAFYLARIAGGYQILTRPDLAPWTEKFLVGRRRQRLSRAGLEVLAVVAYRQPVTRGDVEAIRGVDCGGVFRTLLERRLVAVKGRASSVGHPLLYVTSDHFLEHFGIESLKDLPKIEEFESLVDRDQARQELEQAGLLIPPEERAGDGEQAETEPVSCSPPDGAGSESAGGEVIA